jgi:uncharacterized SAM-binding protein YcdF (DUF218 family)
VENAREAVKLLAETGTRSMTLVTSNIHYPRAKLIFEQVVSKDVVVNYSLVCPLTQSDELGVGSVDNLENLLSEVFKYYYYWMRFSFKGSY